MASASFKTATSWTAKKGDLLVLPYCDAEHPCFEVDQVRGPVGESLRTGDDDGATLTVFSGQAPIEHGQARTVRLDGKHSEPELELMKAVAKALADCKPMQAKRVVVFLSLEHEKLVAAVQEGALLGGYRFDTYLSDKPDTHEVLLVTDGAIKGKLKKRLSARKKLLECVNQARDVLNEPPNVLNPPELAKRYKKLGDKAGLDVTVWDHKRLKKENCGGILGVGMGAAARPRLVVGRYKPAKAKTHLCLVGKGVTFDTGGYCLKPSEYQVGMKYDMGGAAMMFAAACAIARLKLPVQVTVLTPLAENDVSGEAYLTTSVLTTRSGKTVEVHNTDAEGRLILADALTLAGEKKPDLVIDAATLTGACVVALGEDIAAAYGTERESVQQLIAAGIAEQERFWELPLHMPYDEKLKTTIADCKNLGGKWGGSITAALFLKKWAPEGVPWIHLDIAGPAVKEEPLDHLGTGAKGFGVKTMVRLAESLSGKTVIG